MEKQNIENQNSSIEPKKKKSKKKWIVIAIISIIAVAVISSGSSEPTIEQIDSDSSSTTTSATQEIKPGTSITDNSVKISYKSCNTDFKNYYSYADVKSGYKIIEAVFDFENVSETDDYCVENFECYADGVKCDDFYSVDYEDYLWESISAGRKLTDVKVYFEVPADAEEIELEYEVNMWTEEKYIFVVE